MSSKKRHEGYLMVDHRNSPGVSEELIREAIAGGINCPVYSSGPGQLSEVGFVSCSHCGITVVLNPKRTRPRGYCAKCDHYICDNPGCHLECRPIKKVFDELQAKAFLDLNIKEI